MKTTLHGALLSLAQERNSLAFQLQKEQGGYRSYSWREYADLSLRFSHFFQSKNLGVGDKILLLSENAPEWTMAALAAMNLGAVVVPVASIASFLEVQGILQDAKVKFALVSERVATFRQVQGLLESTGTPALFWDLQKESPLDFLRSHQPLPILARDRNSPAFLIYTSGTTGKPKAVPLTHNNILFDAEAVLKVLEPQGNDRLVSVLPLSHMLEFMGGFVTPFLTGASVTYVKSLKAEDLLAALKDTKATVLLGVPLLFEVIARNLQAKLEGLPGPLPKLFSSFSGLVKKQKFLGKILFFPVHQALGGHLRFFLAGGSRLQPLTYEFFEGLGITVLQGYGLTETSPVLTVTTLQNAGPDHVGAPLPGVEVAIFDEAGNRLAVGQEGEILAKGPNVFSGYLNAEQNNEVFWNGWFRTGDLGTFDEKGLLRITGRKKDIIVTGAGKNVYPEEIEGLLLRSGLFLEACALGMKDSSGHEKVTVVLVPDRSKFSGSVSKNAIVTAAQEICQALAEYQRPQRVEVFSSELPKTSTRKIKKHEVRKILEGEIKSSTPAAAASDLLDPNNELERALAEGILSITGKSEVRRSDSLTADLGLDSLTVVELLSHVEKKFSMRIDGLDFSQVHSVEDLVRVLGFAMEAGSPSAKEVFFAEFSPADNHSLLWKWPRLAANLFLRVLLTTRHRLEVKGLENLQGSGPFVFTPNHASHFDLLSICASLPLGLSQNTHAVAAKDYFFNRWWKGLAARIFVNALPFDRRGRVNESMAKCREALAAGSSLVIFPEGTRSPDGKLNEFKPGVAQLLAGQPKIWAVPVFIDGAYAIMPKGSHFPGSGRLRVIYGRPMAFPLAAQDANALREIAGTLKTAVEALARS